MQAIGDYYLRAVHRLLSTRPQVAARSRPVFRVKGAPMQRREAL